MGAGFWRQGTVILAAVAAAAPSAGTAHAQGWPARSITRIEFSGVRGPRVDFDRFGKAIRSGNVKIDN